MQHPGLNGETKFLSFSKLLPCMFVILFFIISNLAELNEVVEQRSRLTEAYRDNEKNFIELCKNFYRLQHLQHLLLFFLHYKSISSGQSQ